MNNKLKISELFIGLQGEDSFAGVPMLFIRLTNCTRRCWFCDTKYFNKGEFYSIKTLVKLIQKSSPDYVCWTGGEPLLQREQIYEVIDKIPGKYHHLETNGDLLIEEDFMKFDYIVCSPKDKETAKKVSKMIGPKDYYDNLDIKVVTDLSRVGKELIPYATTLMPLTTYNKKKDLQTRKRVWNYCKLINLRYSPRLQVDVWGKERKK